MTDESYGFTAARARLEEIVTQVRKKDTSLEKSLDLLEEGVRLANLCTEQIDHADWVVDAAAAEPTAAAEGEQPESAGDAATADAIEAPAAAEARDGAEAEVVTVVDEVTVIDESGEIVAEMTEVAVFDAETATVSPDFADADDAWTDDSAPADEAQDEDDLRG